MISQDFTLAEADRDNYDPDADITTPEEDLDELEDQIGAYFQRKG
jgi:hypothetical protein